LRTTEIFPEAEIYEEYLHEELVFPNSQMQMEFDVFLPKLHLALEYQGLQHYQDVHVYSPQKLYMERDIAKRRACIGAGISLVEIPYWWDDNKDSLAATISEVRPDLIPKGTVTTTPVPLTPPNKKT